MDPEAWREGRHLTENEALENIEGEAFAPHMSREFDKAALDYVAKKLLPAAIASEDKGLAQKCERVLAKYGIAYPNRVSGFWEPLEVPRSELQVREMFGARLPEFGFWLVGSHTDYPDWLLFNDAGEYVYCEVEHRSSSFARHDHDPALCDLIACWEHDWPECPLPVLEFFSGSVIEPEVSERPRAKNRARLSVNFTGRLAKEYLQPNYAERERRGEYALRRYDELVEGMPESAVFRQIGAELGVSGAAARGLLQRRGVIGKPTALRRQQVRDKYAELRGEYDTKTAAVEAVAQLFGIKPGTVWSHLSRRGE